MCIYLFRCIIAESFFCIKTVLTFPSVLKLFIIDSNIFSMVPSALGSNITIATAAFTSEVLS